MTDWNLVEAFVVTIPSINVVTGERGPSARQVVASEKRALEIVNSGPKDADGNPIRTYARATEADLTAQEVAGIRRAAAEKKATEAAPAV